MNPEDPTPISPDLDLAAEKAEVVDFVNALAGLNVPMAAAERDEHIAAAIAAVSSGTGLIGRLPLTALSRAAAVGFVLLVTFGGLAAADALPGPIQTVAERIASVAGIDVSARTVTETTTTTTTTSTTAPAADTSPTSEPTDDRCVDGDGATCGTAVVDDDRDDDHSGDDRDHDDDELDDDDEKNDEPDELDDDDKPDDDDKKKDESDEDDESDDEHDDEPDDDEHDDEPDDDDKKKADEPEDPEEDPEEDPDDD